MDYRELFKEENEEIMERYNLAMDRIAEIINEESVKEPYRNYFVKTAKFIMQIKELVDLLNKSEMKDWTLEKLEKYNHSLYEDVAGDNYESSYANPAYAKKMLGDDFGGYLSFLYSEIRYSIGYAYESRLTDITIHLELFIEIYNSFEIIDEIEKEEIQKILYWFVSDYTDRTVEYRIRELVDPSLDFATDIVMNSDLNDIRYLFRYGEYVTENEMKMAEFLNKLPQEKIDEMAKTYTEGYRLGFVMSGKDLSIKNSVDIRYTLGFERIIKSAIKNFNDMGLKPIIYRASVNCANRGKGKNGYFGGVANKQYEFDHRDDQAVFLDKAFVERKLGVLKVAYEKYKEKAYKYAGPAVMEIFGEKPFEPKAKEENFKLNEKQQKLYVEYSMEASRIMHNYIKGEERSFTIIAYPIPEIGEKFEEIFEEIVKINTLDYKLYQGIQQKIIDALDKGEGSYVQIKGKDNNQTDLRVSLHELKDSQKETVFENCVADVNIPVGEVFTSPVLKGTNGILHVSQVYLNGYKYIDLKIKFEDGKIADYTCKNFEDEAANKKFMKDNLLFNHETLPLGEFAIGTNTTAYVAAQKYDMADKLPILIAEKMGPHFAVGDTCYSWAEDNRVYNPDKKEIVAKDNEISILRKEDTSKAYFNCHTDITIPYDEIAEISVVSKTGEVTPIILDTRFVLEGTLELNKAFEA